MGGLFSGLIVIMIMKPLMERYLSFFVAFTKEGTGEI